MSNFGISAKPMRKRSHCPFLIPNEDLCDFLNRNTERIIRVADSRNWSTILHKSFMLPAYVDNIDIIGQNLCAFTATLSRLGSSFGY